MLTDILLTIPDMQRIWWYIVYTRTSNLFMYSKYELHNNNKRTL